MRQGRLASDPFAAWERVKGVKAGETDASIDRRERCCLQAAPPGTSCRAHLRAGQCFYRYPYRPVPSFNLYGEPTSTAYH
jgi:hypothetical protein